MSAYLIVDIEIKDPDRYLEYVEQAPAYVARHQGEYLVRGGDPATCEGDWSPGRIVILRFPSRAHVNALLEDPDYRKVAQARWTSTRSNMIVVDGV